MQQDQGLQRAYREGQAESDCWGCTPGKVGQCGVGVGGSQGTPGLGGQSARPSPREEGRVRWRVDVQGALWCGKHGLRHPLNPFSLKSDHKVPRRSS